MERKRSEVKLSIRTQERVEASRAEGHLRVLKMEILKLENRDAEMRQLQLIEDPIDFLQVMLLAANKRAIHSQLRDLEISSLPML